MAYYRKHYRSSKPAARTIQVKFAAACICCGGQINRGETATFYPAGTIAGISEGKVGHLGGLDGTSLKCFNTLKSRAVDAAANDYAGDGLDERYEDGCRDICGL
jgi:hypothetical protein